MLSDSAAAIKTPSETPMLCRDHSASCLYLQPSLFYLPRVTFCMPVKRLPMVLSTSWLATCDTKGPWQCLSVFVLANP